MEEEEEEKDVEEFAFTLGHVIAATAGAFACLATTSSDPNSFISTLAFGIRHVAVNEAFHLGLGMIDDEDDDEDEEMPSPPSSKVWRHHPTTHLLSSEPLRLA